MLLQVTCMQLLSVFLAPSLQPQPVRAASCMDIILVRAHPVVIVLDGAWSPTGLVASKLHWTDAMS